MRKWRKGDKRDFSLQPRKNLYRLDALLYNARVLRDGADGSIRGKRAIPGVTQVYTLSSLLLVTLAIFSLGISLHSPGATLECAIILWGRKTRHHITYKRKTRSYGSEEDRVTPIKRYECLHRDIFHFLAALTNHWQFAITFQGGKKKHDDGYI